MHLFLILHLLICYYSAISLTQPQVWNKTHVNVSVHGKRSDSEDNAIVLLIRSSAVALMRQACVRRLSPSVCTECVVAKRCVLEQKLLLTAYRKSYI